MTADNLVAYNEDYFDVVGNLFFKTKRNQTYLLATISSKKSERINMHFLVQANLISIKKPEDF